MWDQLGCYSTTCTVGSNANVSYICDQGVAQYNQTNCPDVGLPDLLIETSTGSAGSDCGHWTEADYDNELMTPISEVPGVDQPLSRFTIGAMSDIWGPVNVLEANNFTCPGVGAASVMSGPQHTSILLRPVNIKDALIQGAAMGETVYEHQLVNLTPAERQEVVDALAQMGKTVDQASPHERQSRRRR